MEGPDLGSLIISFAYGTWNKLQMTISPTFPGSKKGLLITTYNPKLCLLWGQV